MPRLEPDTCRDRFASGRVARLGTVDDAGRAHLVPVVFAVEGDTVYSPIDHKPKSTPDLVRARNIARDPRVTFLVDHWDEEWTQLWWVRARGRAQIVHDGPAWDAAVAALTSRYEPYRETPLTERMLVTSVDEWAGWAWEA